MSSVPAEREIETAPAADSPVSRRVLVVDDSRLQRKILSSLLAKWGFEVLQADSGQEALKLCHEYQPSLVLSDWMMPGMSGLEFCQHFREMTQDNYGYFILLTSKSEKNEIAEGLDAGADDFLTKPVDAGELRARITAGERIIEMQRELKLKNNVISDTLEKLQEVYDSLDKDLREAKKLQQSLVRETFRRFDGGDLSLLLRSSGHVGGDLVGFFQISERQLGLYAIDVSGHGISSALMTARVAGYLSAASPDQNIALERNADGVYQARPLAEAIGELNEVVLNEMETEHYFTLLLATIDLDTGAVQMAQAGHPHPIIQRTDGRIEQDGPGGFPVGLMNGVSFSQFDIQLNPGDRLILLSDGVTECPLPSGDILGEDGIGRLVVQMPHVSGPEFLDQLVERLAGVAELEDFPDDVSGVLFEYRPDQSPK